MGGTFDPVHYGHLVAAESARAEFGLDEVVFVPAGLPPHKRSDAVSGGMHRYVMALLATAANPHFRVSRVELDREGPTFTVDTMRLLKQRVSARTRLFFITGADALLDILTWKQPDQLLELCEIIVASRPGSSFGRMDEALGPLYGKYEARIHTINVPAVAISSTDIRRRIASGRPIRYLVPDPVMHYIDKKRLYVQGMPRDCLERYSLGDEESE